MLKTLLIASAMVGGLLFAVACASPTGGKSATSTAGPTGPAGTTAPTSPAVTIAPTGTTSTPAPSSPAVTTAPTSPARPAPAIPNGHSGRSACRVCHENPTDEHGVTPPSFPAVPDHSAVEDRIEVCSSCHQKDF